MAQPKAENFTGGYAVASDTAQDPLNPIFSAPPIDRQALLKPQSQLLFPQLGYKVSNQEDRNTIIYVPGIMTEDLRPGAQAIANLKGRPVLGVENDTRGIFRDLGCCGAFAVNVDWGALAESAAVRTTREALHLQISRGINPTVYAHSEGNFIVNAAIKQEKNFLLSEGRTLAEVEFLIGRINVYRYGSPQNVSEVGSSEVFEHSQDPVSKIGSLDDRRHKILNLITGRIRDANNVTKIKDDTAKLPIDIASHSVIRYVENNPDFYDASRKNLSPQGKAFTVKESIRSGCFSDQEHDRIISRMLEGAERGEKETFAFARALLEYAPQGRIGNYYFTQENWDKVLRAAGQY